MPDACHIVSAETDMGKLMKTMRVERPQRVTKPRTNRHTVELLERKTLRYEEPTSVEPLPDLAVSQPRPVESAMATRVTEVVSLPTVLRPVLVSYGVVQQNL